MTQRNLMATRFASLQLALFFVGVFTGTVLDAPSLGAAMVAVFLSSICVGFSTLYFLMQEP